MKYQIFISYRRDGAEALGHLLYSELTDRGYDVFFDVESLRSGKFNEELFRVIDECSSILVLLPPGGLERCINEDDWVRKEIAYAIKRKKNIIPIMMRGFQFPDHLPEELENLRYYNGIEANMQFFSAVLDKLTGQFIDAQPIHRRIPKNHKKTLSKFCTCVIGLLILALPLLLKYTYNDTWPIPGYLKTYLEFQIKLTNPVVFFIIIICCAISCYYQIGGDAKYLSNKCKENNLAEHDFFVSPNILLRKIILITDARNFTEKPVFSDLSETYTYNKNLNGIEIRSHEGNKTDYFFLHQDDWPSNLRVLLIGSNTTRHQAIKLLTSQQFDYCESDGLNLRFQKNDMNVRLTYSKYGLFLRNLEILSQKQMINEVIL